jgi:hypothetical protein
MSNYWYFIGCRYSMGFVLLFCSNIWTEKARIHYIFHLKIFVFLFLVDFLSDAMDTQGELHKGGRFQCRVMVKRPITHRPLLKTCRYQLLVTFRCGNFSSIFCCLTWRWFAKTHLNQWPFILNLSYQ